MSRKVWGHGDPPKLVKIGYLRPWQCFCFLRLSFALTYDSDVETSHARIEEKLFDIEDLSDAYDLRCKAWSYEIYFNLIRPNSCKNYKTPLKIIAEEFGCVDPELLTLPPIIPVSMAVRF